MDQSPVQASTRALDHVLFERRISNKAFLGSYLISILIGVLVAIILFSVGFGWLSPLGIAPAVIIFIKARLATMGTCYRLFGDRLEVQSGLLTRSIENVQLFRVHDVSLRQGLMGRLGNYGDVLLFGSDTTNPTTTVVGIDRPDDLYQELRGLIAQARQTGRTLYVE